MRREDRETIPGDDRTVFDKLSIRWGLVIIDDQIAIPIDFRRQLLVIFFQSLRHYENDVRKEDFLMAVKQDIEDKVKDCTSCLASSKNLKNQIPIKTILEIRKTIQTRSRNTN